MTKEELEKKRAEQRARKETECKWRTSPLDPCCSAGVNYRELVGGEDFGWMARLPCLPDSPLTKEPVAKCEKYERKSPAEIIAEELEQKAFSDAVVMAIGAIRKQGKDSGEVSCPKCYAGKVHYSVAKLNGHIWGRCTTDGCISWMM